MSGRRRDLLLALTMAAAATAVYWPALGSGFYSDDYQWLGRMSPTLERPDYLFTVFYRDFNPVLHASFLLDWMIGGARGEVWHAQSIVIHGLCAALLFLLCRGRRAGPAVAAAATLVWAWNVRISEAVIWPAARGHSLATLFGLAGLVALTSSLPRRRVLAVALFAVGLLAKETALFPMLLAPLFLPDWRREKGLLATLGGIAVAFVAFNVLAKESFHASDAGVAELILKVPFLLLRPLGLGDVYGFGWPGLLGVAALFGAAAWLLRRGTGLTGLLWIGACTLPLVPLEKLSSRYLYMPAVGYALLFCGAAAWLASRLRESGPRRLAAGGAATLLALVWTANVVDIQREIADYGVLGRPYRECVEALRQPLRSLAPGETAVLVDLGPRDAISTLHHEIRERGNMRKLIPYRQGAVDGLIELTDLLNLVRDRTPGLLGSATDPTDAPGPRRWFVYDGRAVSEIEQSAGGAIPDELISAATWTEARRYFAGSKP